MIVLAALMVVGIVTLSIIWKELDKHDAEMDELDAKIKAIEEKMYKF